MKCGSPGAKYRDRLLAVAGHPHLKPRILQQALQHRAVLPLIVHHQDAVLGFAGFQTDDSLPAGPRRSDVGCPRRFQRKFDAKPRSLARRALHVDRTAHQLHELPRDGEAQPGTLVCHRLANLHEGLEDPRLIRPADADPGILHAERERQPSGAIGGSQPPGEG